MESNEKALKYALNILNRKDYTEFEMHGKLKNKGFENDSIEKTMQYLKDKNFLNDERYTENFVYFKLRNGYGKIRIEYELKKKGINLELIDKYLKDIDEKEFAKMTLDAKLQSLKDKKNRYAKLSSYLARRGYGYDIINELLNSKEETI